jgi:antitoxin YqcF
VSVDLRRVAKHELALLGGEPQVTRYRHDGRHDLWVDVLVCADRPQASITSYATIGISRFDNGATTRDGHDLRVELLGAAPSGFVGFANALVTVGFNLADGACVLRPGTLQPDALGMYDSHINVPHLLLVPPFAWDEPVGGLYDGDAYVTWLQAVPVTDSELAYAQNGGSNALRGRLESSSIDVLDLTRSSVVD